MQWRKIQWRKIQRFPTVFKWKVHLKKLEHGTQLVPKIRKACLTKSQIYGSQVHHKMNFWSKTNKLKNHCVQESKNQNITIQRMSFESTNKKEEHETGKKTKRINKDKVKPIQVIQVRERNRAGKSEAVQNAKEEGTFKIKQEITLNISKN